MIRFLIPENTQISVKAKGQASFTALTDKPLVFASQPERLTGSEGLQMLTFTQHGLVFQVKEEEVKTLHSGYQRYYDKAYSWTGPVVSA